MLNILRSSAALTAACVFSVALPAPAAQALSASRAAPVARAGASDAAGYGPSATRRLVKDLVGAWQITRGKGVTVAIIGDAVDARTPGLAGKVTTGPRYGHMGHAPKQGASAFAAAVAGSGPSQGNPFNSLGLAPDARILSIQVQPAAPAGVWENNDAKAIRYAVNHHAKVVFVDEVAYSDTSDLDSAVAYAVSKNVAVIADEFAWGGNRDEPEAPNSLPGVMGAGAVNFSGMRQPPRRHPTPVNWSILVSAPGNDFLVTEAGGMGWIIYNSFSAGAWLTATVALIKSVYPNLSSALVEKSLAISARSHPHGGYNDRVGFGIIDPLGALREAAKLRKLKVASPVGPGVTNPSARLTQGPAPGVIHAVRHSALKLAGFGGAIAAGLLLLLLAALLPVRWRRRLPAVPPVPGAAPPLPWPAGGWTASAPGAWPAGYGTQPPGPPGSWSQPGSGPPGLSAPDDPRPWETRG